MVLLRVRLSSFTCGSVASGLTWVRDGRGSFQPFAWAPDCHADGLTAHCPRSRVGLADRFDLAAVLEETRCLLLSSDCWLVHKRRLCMLLWSVTADLPHIACLFQPPRTVAAMSLRALADMDHTDPRLTEVVKEVAADLGRVRAGSLCRLFSELDSHALRTVQEESLSVAGRRLIEAEKPWLTRRACCPWPSGLLLCPSADGPPAPSASHALPEALDPDKGIKPSAAANPGTGSNDADPLPDANDPPGLSDMTGGGSGSNPGEPDRSDHPRGQKRSGTGDLRAGGDPAANHNSALARPV